MSKHRLFKRANGAYAFASSNPRWFNMGQTVPEAMTSQEALAATGMDAMRFSEHPVYTTVDGFTDSDGQIHLPTRMEYKGHKAIVLEEVEFGRLTPVDVLRQGREVFQPEQLIEPLDRVLDVSEATIETFGLTASGAEWFAFLRLPRGVTIGGDEHAAYLFGRDGLRTSFTVAGAWERLWCFNMFPAAIARARRQSTRYVLQHRHGAKISVAQIREAVRLTYAEADELDAAAKVLLDQPMTVDEFSAFTDTVFGVPADDAGIRAQNNYRFRNAQLRHIFVDSESVDTTYRGGSPTRWTAFQAVTEWLDHKSPVRSTDKAARRMERLVSGEQDAVKAGLLEALR